MSRTRSYSSRDKRLGRGLLVLVVREDPAARTWMVETLREAGFEVCAFARAFDVMSTAPRQGFECAIVGSESEDGDVPSLQADLMLAGTSVICATPEPSVRSCIRALRDGAADYLSLPCNEWALIEAVQDATHLTQVEQQRRSWTTELAQRWRRLTERERQVFTLVTNGLLNKQVALDLGISEITVQIHRGRAMRKMRAASFAELVRMADALSAVSNQRHLASTYAIASYRGAAKAPMALESGGHQ